MDHPSLDRCNSDELTTSSGSPLAKEEIPSSRDILHERILQQLQQDQPSICTEQARELVDRIFERFDDRALNQFMSCTFPRIVGPIVRPPIAPRLLVSLLSEFLESGALEHALPRLLRLPEFDGISMALIFGRLSAISRHAKEGAPEVFRETLPLVMDKCVGQFSPESLYTFHELCKVMQEHTADACRLIYELFEDDAFSRLPLKIPVHLIERLGADQNSTAAFGCLEFCCCLSKNFKIVASDQAVLVFSEGSKIWREWGEHRQADLAEQLLEFMTAFQHRVPALMVMSELFSNMEDVGHADAIMAGSYEVRATGDIDLFLRHVRNVTPFLGIFPTEHAAAMVEFLGAGVLRGQDGVCAHLLSNLVFKAFGFARVACNLAFLKDIVNRFTTEQFNELEFELNTRWNSWADILYPRIEIEDTPLNYILVGIIKGGNERFNPWPISEKEFHRRWQDSINFHEKPLFSLNEVSFKISMAPEGVTVQLRKGVLLDQAFLEHRYQQFSPPTGEEQIALVNELWDRVAPAPFKLRVSRVSDVFEILKLASERLTRQEYVAIVKKSFPLLPLAAGHKLFTLPATGRTADECFDYLESLRLLVDDGIVVILSRHGMKRPFIDEIKRTASIVKIKRELSKFEKCVATNDKEDQVVFEFETSRNVIDEFYDQLAETCIRDGYSTALGKKYFQGVRIVCGHDIIGCLYMLLAPVEGRNSLVLAGGGLRRSILKAVDTNQFSDLMVSAMANVVKSNNWGGFFVAVGKPKDGKTWSSEGRIAQTEEAVASLMPQNPELIELDPREHIDFPPNYTYGPIIRVARLA